MLSADTPEAHEKFTLVELGVTTIVLGILTYETAKVVYHAYFTPDYTNSTQLPNTNKYSPPPPPAGGYDGDNEPGDDDSLDIDLMPGDGMKSQSMFSAPPDSGWISVCCITFQSSANANGPFMDCVHVMQWASPSNIATISWDDVTGKAQTNYVTWKNGAARTHTVRPSLPNQDHSFFRIRSGV
jgi:hypothetical protein